MKRHNTMGTIDVYDKDGTLTHKLRCGLVESLGSTHKVDGDCTDVLEELNWHLRLNKYMIQAIEAYTGKLSKKEMMRFHKLRGAMEQFATDRRLLALRRVALDELSKVNNDLITSSMGELADEFEIKPRGGKSPEDAVEGVEGGDATEVYRLYDFPAELLSAYTAFEHACAIIYKTAIEAGALADRKANIKMYFS